MEDAMRRSNHGGGIKEERGSVDADRRYIGSVGGDESDCKEVVVAMVVGSNPRKSSSPEQEGLSLTKEVPINEGRSTMESDPKAPSSISNLLESARAQMGVAREENQRLKMYLDKKMKDYQALQMQFYGIIQQEETKESTETTANSHKVFEEQDPVSLSLGFSRDPKSDNGTKNLKISGQRADAEEVDRGLSLGLDCKFDLPKSYTSEKRSPVNSLEEAKEESGETWRPSKVMKTIRSGDDDEVLQQNPFKKARVSVRARCDNPTMNDGCQWRKYGQKISKGNPCPRAYYRCTIGSSCPVRKQVQRCADDMSILIATYEGTHNHPLPVSATPMASTTSAAASMLLTGSSSSSSSALHGLKFYLSNDNSKLSNNPFYIQNPSLASSLSHPTITLDLTSNPPTSSSHFNSFPSSYVPVPKFPSTSLSFGSSESSAMAGGNLYPSYGSTSQHYNRNHLGTLINLGRQSVDSNIYQSYMQKNPHPQPSLPDTVAAATKAITADPSFQSALAAALTSLIGTGSGNSSTACSSSYTNK